MKRVSEYQWMKSVLSSTIYKTIEDIWLVGYKFKETINFSDVLLQIAFSDDSTLLLDVSNDGEMLRVGNLPWHDPFKDNLSAENIAYIDQYGKLISASQSSNSPYKELIKQTVGKIFIFLNGVNKPIGVQLKINKLKLYYWVEFDEGKVSVTHAASLPPGAVQKIFIKDWETD